MEESPDGFSIQTYQQTFTNLDAGIRASKRKSRYSLDADGAPDSVEIDLSSGGSQKYQIRSKKLYGNGKYSGVDLEDAVNFLIEGNNPALFDLLLLLRGAAPSSPVSALLPEGPKSVPVRFSVSGRQISSSLGETYLVDANNRINHVQVPSPDFEFVRAERALPRNWPHPLASKRYEYAPPAGISVEDVRISKPDYVADATVAKPPNGITTNAVCLFIGGTGVYNRHGLANRIDTGTHRILDTLATVGLASVRFDKFNHLDGPPVEALVEQDLDSLSRDAFTGLIGLKPKIGPKRFRSSLSVTAWVGLWH